MRLRSSLVWKNWVSNPLRAGLTLLGVALGVAVVTSIHVLDHNTVLSELRRKRGDFGRVDFELRPLAAKPDLWKELAALSGDGDLAEVGLLGRAEVLCEVPGRAPIPVPLFGIHPLGTAGFGHYRVQEGRDLDPLGEERKVLVSPLLAGELGLRPGSRLRVRALPRAAALACLDGRRTRVSRSAPEPEKAVELKVAGILAPFRLARRNAGRILIGRFSLARRSATVFAPRIQVRRKPGVDPDRLRERLEKRFAVDDARSALIGEGADERAFRNGVKVLGCLALVLGMFVIFHTLSHSLAERMREVGILRCLGATRGQILRIFLGEAAGLSFLGVSAGLGLGLLLAAVLARMKITTLGLGKTVTTFEIPWGPTIWILVLGVGFTMIGAAFPLAKAHGLSPRRILHVRDLAPPADLMRGVNVFLFVAVVCALPAAYLAMTPLLAEEGRGAGLVLLEVAGLAGFFFGLLLLAPGLVRRFGALVLRPFRARAPLAAFLVGKNLGRSPGRIASAVCGLSLVALAMLGLRALTGSLEAEVRAFGARALRGRIFLRCDPLPESSWKELRALPGVRSVLPFTARAAFPFLVLGIEAEALSPPEGAPELLAAMKERRGIWISTRLARLRGLGVGSRIPVPTDRGIVRYEVLRISDEEGFFPDERAFALCDREWLRKDFCLRTDRAGRFAFRLREDADAEALIPILRRRVEKSGAKVGWIRTGAEVEAFHVADVGRDFLFFDVLLGLLLLLAGTGQVNLLTLSAISRAREIWILRALGMTRRGWFAVLALESLVVGVLAAVLALLAGIPLAWILIEGLREVSGLEVPFHLPWRESLLAGGAACVVSLCAALPPALRLPRHAFRLPVD